MVLGLPGRSASQVEKSPRLNWATQFWRWHTMVHVPLMFLPEWREFLSAPCLAGGGGGTWWQLFSPCCWNRARRLTCFLSASVTRKDLQLGTWTTLSIPSYEIGKNVGIRTYQHPLMLLRCSYIIYLTTCFGPLMGHLPVEHFPLWGKPYNWQCYNIVVNEISLITISYYCQLYGLPHKWKCSTRRWPMKGPKHVVEINYVRTS